MALVCSVMAMAMAEAHANFMRHSHVPFPLVWPCPSSPAFIPPPPPFSFFLLSLLFLFLPPFASLHLPRLLRPSHFPPMVFDQRELEVNGFDGIDVEGVKFAATVVSPGSTHSLVLGGAGDRGLTINGHYIKFTAIGIYVDKDIVNHLSPKLGGKSADELCNDELLFEEVLTAPYEKFVRVVFLAPLTGIQYSEKVIERIGVQAYSIKLREGSKQKFLETFKAENFPPGSSVLFSFSKEGLKVAFSSDDTVPTNPVAVIEDETFATAVLATIIWKDGVSPAAKTSFAHRLSKHLVLSC